MKNAQRQRSIYISDKLYLGPNSVIIAKDAAGIETVYTINEIVGENVTTGITANSGGGQPNAVELAAGFTNVTVSASDGDSVKLPNGALGKQVSVKNSGTNSIAVFPGTADQINAMAVNLSVNIAPGGMQTFTGISESVWETSEVLVLHSPATQNGELIVKASNNSGDYVITLTNASMGQATVISIPDPLGATGTLVIEEITNTFDAAQKYNVATPAAAGVNAGNATAMTAEFNMVTAADNATGVALPEAAVGWVITVVNTVKTAELFVYPVSGGDDNINGLLEDVAYRIPAGETRVFTCTSATQWYTGEESPTQKAIFEEDFIGDAIDARISSTAGAGSGNAVLTITANTVNGIAILTSSNTTVNHANDASSVSLDGLNYRANQGGLAIEARVSINDVTQVAVFIGFSDVISTTVELPLFMTGADLDSDAQDACGIFFDTESNTDQWGHGGVKSDGDTAPAFSGTAPTNGAYTILRVEVDTAGGVQGYIDGVPIAGGVIANAITADDGTMLTPYIAIANRTTSARILTVDYFRVEQNR